KRRLAQRIAHTVKIRQGAGADLRVDALRRQVVGDRLARPVGRVVLFLRRQCRRTGDGAPMVEDVRDVMDPLRASPRGGAQDEIVVLAAFVTLAKPAYRLDQAAAEHTEM